MKTKIKGELNTWYDTQLKVSLPFFKSIVIFDSDSKCTKFTPFIKNLFSSDSEVEDHFFVAEVSYKQDDAAKLSLYRLFENGSYVLRTSLKVNLDRFRIIDEFSESTINKICNLKTLSNKFNI